METKKIKALLAAVECGSLTSAAESLGYTQSGMTHMMNALEDELGLNLLIRGKTGIKLSPAGQLLLPQMTALISAADTLANDAARLCERNYSTLRIGTHSSIVREWLPEILSEFRTRYPDIDTSITMSSVPSLYSSLRNGDLDLAIVSYDKALAQKLSWIPLRKDNYVAVLPADYPVSGSSFSLEDFNEIDLDFFMPSDGFSNFIYRIFDENNIKLTAKIKETNMEDSVIISMVGHNLGATITTDLIMQGMRQKNVQVLPLKQSAHRDLGIAVSDISQNDRNIRHFAQCAQTAISKMYLDT